MLPKILKQKDLKEMRKGASCAFCGATTDLVVEHQHIEQMDDDNNDSRIRGVLCRTCNGTYCLAAIERNIRALSKRTNRTLVDTVELVSNYLTADYSNKPLHPNTITDLAKLYKRKPATEQKRILLDVGIKPDKNTMSRVKQYKKLIRSQL